MYVFHTPPVGSADPCCRDILTRMVVIVMGTGMDIPTHHLHPSYLNRRTHFSVTTIMTITGMSIHMITTITVIHILTTHTLTPQPRNRAPTRTQTHTLTLIHTHHRTPLPLRSKYLRGDTFLYQPLIIIPILNSLHALTPILPITPTRISITRVHIPMHTCTRQHQTG
jgi:hypothetical protein